MFESDKTVLTLNTGSRDPTVVRDPEIIVQQRGCLASVALSGEQLLGRSAQDAVPDIPINAPFVSRRHGLFSVRDAGVFHNSLESTNGTYYNGRRMGANETVALNDGDLLHIYSDESLENYTDLSRSSTPMATKTTTRRS